MWYGERVYCNEETNTCFAQSKNHPGICTLLSSSYPEGHCPFKKRYRDETDGVYYPTLTADALISKREKMV